MQASARLSSSAAFRKVIAGVSSATIRSCYRTSRGKAHAAPAQAAQAPPRKGRKRIPMQERRAMIMEFVDNYRASNEGKFPTVTNTHKQIKGSYYTVLRVLQEMKYNHANGIVEVTKQPARKDDARVPQKKGIPEVSEPSVAEDDADVAQRQGTVEVSVHSLPKDVGKVDQFQGTERESYKDLTDKPDPGNQQREIEANEFDSKKSLDVNASDKSVSDVVNEPKTHARDDNPKHEESTNTGLLSSLKSFAYGIRNFWKNM